MSALPRPRLPRPLHLKGVRFAGETAEDQERREAEIEDAIQKIDAEEQRLWKWKTTPIWEM